MFSIVVCLAISVVSFKFLEVFYHWNTYNAKDISLHGWDFVIFNFIQMSMYIAWVFLTLQVVHIILINQKESND